MESFEKYKEEKMAEMPELKTHPISENEEALDHYILYLLLSDFKKMLEAEIEDEEDFHELGKDEKAFIDILQSSLDKFSVFKDDIQRVLRLLEDEVLEYTDILLAITSLTILIYELHGILFNESDA